MSTVTGRQLEFETVDLEAIREACLDHMDKEESKAKTSLNERGMSAPAAAALEAPKPEEEPDIDFTDDTDDVQESAALEAPKPEEEPDIDFTDNTDDVQESAASEAPKTQEMTDSGLSDDTAELFDGFGGREIADEADPVYFEMVIEQLSKKYEDKHRMSMELSSDVFAAIGKAKECARRKHEEAVQQAEEASAVVDDATRKLKVIERRYEKARSEELLVKRELQKLPYVAEAAITQARKDIEQERDELAGFIRELPLAEQFEVTARAEALTALRATLEPQSYAAEKKKVLDDAEKLRDLTDYLLTVAKESKRKEKLEAEYTAARREASIRNKAYSEAYREYARAESLLEDARAFAREKRNIYDTAHKDTMKIRRKIDTFKDLIEAEESKVSNMVKASAKYDKVFAEYQKRKKTRFVKSRQLDAAREEYARLLGVLAEAKNRAEDAADRMYRAEKISVRDVIETDVKDPDFLYLNRYGALLAKAQADEQAALGELRRAQKKSDTV